MGRPTISDLARAAGVSVSTVDRVLNGRDPVRRDNADRVMRAAEEIGFRAVGQLRQRLGPPQPQRSFGFLLQGDPKSFYGMLGDALAAEAKANTSIRADVRVELIDGMMPEAVADRLLKLGRRMHAVGVVTADHPRITQAIEALSADGVPVVALISDLTASARAGYIGLDAWKVGRTAAWAIAHLCRQPGKVGILVGSHRYLCQDVSESGFRSWFRELGSGFTLLDAVTSLEDARLAYENTLHLLRRAPDLAGLYVAGGGIAGVMAALREHGVDRRVVAVGRELTPETHSGLIDGTLQMVLSHPLKELARSTIDALVQATQAGKREPFLSVQIPLAIWTPESV